MGEKIIQFPRSHPSGQVDRSTRREEAARRQEANEKKAAAIDIRINELAKAKRPLAPDQRFPFARNLGSLLEIAKKKHGALTAIFEKARIAGRGDHTKRLPRFAAFDDNFRPGKSFSPKIGKYRDIAKACASILREHGTALLDDEALIKLCAGTILDPDSKSNSPELMAELEALEDLVTMLTTAGQSIIRRYELQDYFEKISRHSISVDDTGERLRVSDHPEEPRLEDGPEDFFVGLNDRVGMIPMLPLYEIPDPDSDKEIVKEIVFDLQSPEAEEASAPACLSFSLERVVSWALMPTDTTKTVVPAFFESAKLCVWFDRTGPKWMEEGFFAAMLRRPSFQGQQAWNIWNDLAGRMLGDSNKPDSDDVPQKLSFELNGKSYSLTARPQSSPDEVRSFQTRIYDLGGFRCAPVSLISARKFLFDLIANIPKDEVLGSTGLNVGLTFAFQGDTRAPQGTIAAYLERCFRYVETAPDVGINPADALEMEAKRQTDRLREYLHEADQRLRRNTEDFVSRWAAKDDDSPA